MKKEVSPAQAAGLIAALVLVLGTLGFMWLRSNDNSRLSPESEALIAKMKAEPDPEKRRQMGMQIMQQQMEQNKAK